MEACQKWLTAGILAALLGAVPARAASATLAPAKPSQIVTLKSSSNDCPLSGKAVDTRLLPDGSFQPFVIPEKQVLVITEVDWGVVSAPASQSVVLNLSVQAPSALGAVPFLLDVASADSAGIAGGSSAVANAIVRAGNTLCVGLSTGPPAEESTIVRGFLTKDR